MTDASKHMRHVRNVNGNIRDTHDPARPGTGPAWAKLEKDIIIFTLGTFFIARRSRLRDIAWINTLQETKGLRWESLKKGTIKRAKKLRENKMTRNDQRLIQETEARLQSG